MAPIKQIRFLSISLSAFFCMFGINSKSMYRSEFDPIHKSKYDKKLHFSVFRHYV